MGAVDVLVLAGSVQGGDALEREECEESRGDSPMTDGDRVSSAKISGSTSKNTTPAPHLR